MHSRSSAERAQKSYWHKRLSVDDLAEMAKSGYAENCISTSKPRPTPNAKKTNENSWFYGNSFVLICMRERQKERKKVR